MNYQSFPNKIDFIRIVLFTVVSFLLIQLYKYLGNISNLEEHQMLFVDVLYYGIIIGYCAFRYRGFRLQNTSISIRTILLLVPSVVLLLAVGLIGGAISSGFELILPEFLQVSYPMMWFYSTVLIAPIAEEVIFRGFIFNGLEHRFSARETIFISAIVFGLCHIYPQFIIYGFIGGLALGYIYYHTRSLLICIIAHASTNFIGWKVQSNSPVVDASFTERSLLSDLSAGIVLIFVLYFIVSFSIALIQKNSVMKHR